MRYRSAIIATITKNIAAFSFVLLGECTTIGLQWQVYKIRIYKCAIIKTRNHLGLSALSKFLRTMRSTFMSMMQNIQQDTWKHMVGEKAATLIEQIMVIGLGSGSTATLLNYALAQRIQNRLRIVDAVPTSEATEQLAGSLGNPLTNLDTHPELDLDIYGADEIDAQL